MTENLFDAPQTTDDVSLRDELTNKWKDKPADELLKAKVESDLYIKTLERQKDELRTDYLKQRDELLAKAKFEELLDRFEKAPREPNLQVAPPLANEVEPKYDPKQIESLVLSKINETKIAEKETDNFNKVQSKLTERFGNNSLQFLRNNRVHLDCLTTDVNALARNLQKPSLG
jgi:hypothetical protein